MNKPKPFLPVPTEDADILHAIGPDALLAWIVAGDRYKVIAARVGVPTASLACWIHNLPDEAKELFDAATRVSAEILLDDADEILDAPADMAISGPNVNLRKHRADSRRARAEIRNPEYRPGATRGGPPVPTTPPPPPFHITITLPDAAAIDRHRRMIEGEYSVDLPLPAL